MRAGGISSSSGGSTPLLQNVPWGLRRVELKGFNFRPTRRDQVEWRDPVDRLGRTAGMLMGVLQQAAADMAAALP
jgi:hypothetical protein